MDCWVMILFWAGVREGVDVKEVGSVKVEVDGKLSE